jgi:GxxExxY protein
MSPEPLLEERLTGSVIGAFYEGYNTLGFGFLEHLYAAALERELRARSHLVERERSVTIRYKGAEIGLQRLDFVVDARLVVEIKSTRALHPSAMRQLHNYLCASGLGVGLLLHFGPEPAFYRVVGPGARRVAR